MKTCKICWVTREWKSAYKAKRKYNRIKKEINNIQKWRENVLGVNLKSTQENLKK